MTPPNSALYITCLFLTNIAPMATLYQSSLHFQSDDVGESVTLPCVCDDAAMLFYWYKQTPGQEPKLVSTFYKYNNNSSFHHEFKNNLRFSLETESGKSHLKISDLKISDSATYYCVESNLLDFKFCNGVTVSVQGSRLNLTVLVHQSASDSIQPGGSVTLNCTVHTGTCDGQHSVYWFKDSEESHPGLIYTHGGRNDQCERKPNTQTHTCVYNLPMKSLNLSHAGTYYCAVASCGHILFGDGTKLVFKDDRGSLVLVYFLSGALAFTNILVVLLAFSVYKMNKRNSQSAERNVTFSASSTQNTALCQDAENLHYAALRDHNRNRSRRPRDNTQTECVYSGVRP
ncbi:uncharacterized protein LOC129093435 [Anoplopoma fimbria]|uniref:uncharacterized protein LOC129093435 n=1 Tax=Anoplopoma fimbria TaxID=229290 RepID=UPI0023EBCDA2|nr:uncharacterized protein LOC129093435 [Anoplopoma fimbria]